MDKNPSGLMGEMMLEKICDIHVHVGRFAPNHYYSPSYVVDRLHRLGLQTYAVSSITTCGGDTNLAQQEIREVMKLDPQRVVPLLWVIPEMIRRSPNLREFEGIGYKGIKLHPYSSPWWPGSAELHRVFAIAADRGWPVLMHTGWTPESEAGRFLEVYRKYPRVPIILAHGRPLEQAALAALECEQIYIDTAFMPLKDIYYLTVKLGMDRLVLGSDFPVDRFYYPRSSPVNRYRRRIKSLLQCFGESSLKRWGNAYFKQIFYKDN